VPLLWLELEELEAVVRALATGFEEWKWRSWAPDCHRALTKLMETQIKERRNLYFGDEEEEMEGNGR